MDRERLDALVNAARELERLARQIEQARLDRKREPCEGGSAYRPEGEGTARPPAPVESRLKVRIRRGTGIYIIRTRMLLAGKRQSAFGARPKTIQFMTHATPITISNGTPVLSDKSLH